MSANGWLQILISALVILAVTKPLVNTHRSAWSLPRSAWGSGLRVNVRSVLMAQRHQLRVWSYLCAIASLQFEIDLQHINQLDAH